MPGHFSYCRESLSHINLLSKPRKLVQYGIYSSPMKKELKCYEKEHFIATLMLSCIDFFFRSKKYSAVLKLHYLYTTVSEERSWKFNQVSNDGKKEPFLIPESSIREGSTFGDRKAMKRLRW